MLNCLSPESPLLVVSLKLACVLSSSDAHLPLPTQVACATHVGSLLGVTQSVPTAQAVGEGREVSCILISRLKSAALQPKQGRAFRPSGLSLGSTAFGLAWRMSVSRHCIIYRINIYRPHKKSHAFLLTKWVLEYSSPTKTKNINMQL